LFVEAADTAWRIVSAVRQAPAEKKIKTLQKFIPFSKVEEEKDGTLLVHGLATAEVPDLDSEVMDYETTKPHVKALAEKFLKATSTTGVELSMFPLREMHAAIAAGSGRSIEFDDAAKTICVSAHVVDVGSCKKVLAGTLIGYSIGGDYAKKWKDPVFEGKIRYTAVVQEISLVDSPALPIAMLDTVNQKSYQFIKADGSMELRKFHVEKPSADERLGAQIDRLASVIEKTLDKGTTTATATVATATATVDKPTKKPLDLDAFKAAMAKLKKFSALSEFEKGMYDIHDLTEVMSTLSYVQGSLTSEREWEGDDSKVPEAILAVMQELQTAFLSLVEEETQELLDEAKRRANGGKKSMAIDTLQKATTLLTLAKSGLQACKGMVTAHHNAVVAMHKGFHSDIHAAPSLENAKAAATEHLGKAITMAGEHMTKMHAALDKTIGSMEGEGGGSTAMPEQGAITEASPASVGEGNAHTLKAADIEAMMTKKLEEQQSDRKSVV
jgi:hypothetical protein